MSASTEKRNRQSARVVGSDRKTLASQKEEQKKKKEKIKWTAIAVAVAVFFAFVIYLNTGAFYRNLTGITVEYNASEELGVKVLDRSGLILDIFAQRAQTREGQLQVELAQYKYLLPTGIRPGALPLHCAPPLQCLYALHWRFS